MRAIAESFDEYAKLNEKIGKDLVSTIAAMEDPAAWQTPLRPT